VTCRCIWGGYATNVRWEGRGCDSACTCLASQAQQAQQRRSRAASRQDENTVGRAGSAASARGDGLLMFGDEVYRL
jgi:hypothetical protein